MLFPPRIAKYPTPPMQHFLWMLLPFKFFLFYFFIFIFLLPTLANCLNFLFPLTFTQINLYIRIKVFIFAEWMSDNTLNLLQGEADLWLLAVWVVWIIISKEKIENYGLSKINYIDIEYTKDRPLRCFSPLRDITHRGWHWRGWKR